MLQKVWKKWKAFGELLGNIIARIVLTIFYFTVFVPFAIGAQLFNDHLGIKTIPANYWQARSNQSETLEKAKSQA